MLKKLNPFQYYPAALLVYWVCIFSFIRLVFVIVNFSMFEDNITDGLKAFYYGLSMDFSMAGYLCVLPVLLWFVYRFKPLPILSKAIKTVIVILTILVLIIGLSNCFLYKEWQTIIGKRAVQYLSHPLQALASASIWQLLLGALGIIIFTTLCIKRYYKWIENVCFEPRFSIVRSLVLIPITFVVIFFFIRGGFSTSPINESSAYYSNVQISNHAAVNPQWYFIHSLIEGSTSKNTYQFCDEQKANTICAKLFPKSDSISYILKTERPNIVFILLESWTADVIDSLTEGGAFGVTPNMNQLKREGILFVNAYASGYRTDQGLVSLLSGFPAQPNQSIISTPEKASQLPSIIKDLKNEKYTSSFFYGGDISFANMKTYLVNSGCEYTTTISDFAREQLSEKWGAYDEYVLNKQAHYLATQKQPFVSCLLTLSSHLPFDVPKQSQFTGKSMSDKFKNAVHYSDYSLGEYFKKIKNTDWYKNTLFVLCADHGHSLPQERSMDTPESRRITMLLLGGALKDTLKGTKYYKVVNQHDLAKTMLEQLKLNTSDYSWSNNIFAKNYPSFAYYSNENVVGWVNPRLATAFSFGRNDIEYRSKNLDMEVAKQASDTARAYLQKLYQTYLNY